MHPGKQVRIHKLWKHRCNVIIPYDHGSYSGVPKGLDDVRRLTERIARTAADAILVTPGVLKQVAGEVGDLGIILRIDGGFTKFSAGPIDYQPMYSIEDAVSIGADAAIVFTFINTPTEAASIRRLGETAAGADRWGLPLVSEILAPSLLNNHFGRDIFGPVDPEADLDQETLDVARLAAEAGADIIKTRYTGKTDGFRRVVRACGVPVIVAGGPPLGEGVSKRGNVDEQVLLLAKDSVEAGAAGIVFGRNVWQHPRMEQLVAALSAVVHEGESVSRALKLLR